METDQLLLWLIALQIAAGATTLAVVVYLLMKITELHLLLNSRLTELLRITGSEAEMRGRDNARDETARRQLR